MPEQAEKKWCPLARVSIQQREVGRINAVQTGAFNFVIQQMPDGGEMTFIPVTCLGARCALYRKSIFPWRSGMCAVPGSRGPCRLSFPFFPWRWSLPLLFFMFSGGCDVVIKLEWSRHRSLQVVREKAALE